jgi:hypothetical protein
MNTIKDSHNPSISYRQSDTVLNKSESAADEEKIGELEFDFNNGDDLIS